MRPKYSKEQSKAVNRKSKHASALPDFLVKKLAKTAKVPQK
jgi:hypothetical protein